MRTKNILLLLVMILSLSACGFHLRSSQIHLHTKYPTILLPPSGSNTFHQALRRSLLAAKVRVISKVTNEMDAQVPKLMVTSQQTTERPLVYGPDAELRRERMRMAVAFSFSSKPALEFELSTERDRQLNSNQHLGDNAEKILLEQEMQADIINQLLRILAYKNS